MMYEGPSEEGFEESCAISRTYPTEVVSREKILEQRSGLDVRSSVRPNVYYMSERVAEGNIHSPCVHVQDNDIENLESSLSVSDDVDSGVPYAGHEVPFLYGTVQESDTTYHHLLESIDLKLIEESNQHLESYLSVKQSMAHTARSLGSMTTPMPYAESCLTSVPYPSIAQEHFTSDTVPYNTVLETCQSRPSDDRDLYHLPNLSEISLSHSESRSACNTLDEEQVRHGVETKKYHSRQDSRNVLPSSFVESDQVVPEQTSHTSKRHHDFIVEAIVQEGVASDHERFLQEVSHGTKTQGYPTLHDPYQAITHGDHTLDYAARTNTVQLSGNIRTTTVPPKKTEVSPLRSFADFTEAFDCLAESRDHLDQLRTKLINKSYDQINVKLEDDADILTVEVNEMDDVVDLVDVIVDVLEEASLSPEELILLDLCERRRYNIASRSKSVDDTLLLAAKSTTKLTKAQSCLQLLLCNRDTTVLPSVKKVDLLVSHFTMGNLSQYSTEKRVEVRSGQTRSQTFTQSLNTMLGSKQTKSVSFAMDIENIETPKHGNVAEGANKKSKSGSKKSKSCCID